MMRYLLSLSLLLLAACASGPRPIGGAPNVTLVNASELPGPQGQVGTDQRVTYTINPYDKLVIDVLAFTELKDRKIEVDASGRITLPIAGEIEVGGLTLGQASDRITAQLRRGFVRNPQVAVNLEEATSHYVTVEGEVNKPGNIPLVANMSLLRAVAAAQGTTELANAKSVILHRTVNGQKMVALYDFNAVRRGAYADPLLYPQDVVVVGESANRRLLQILLQVSPLLVSPLIAILQN